MGQMDGPMHDNFSTQSKTRLQTVQTREILFLNCVVTHLQTVQPWKFRLEIVFTSTVNARRVWSRWGLAV